MCANICYQRAVREVSKKVYKHISIWWRECFSFDIFLETTWEEAAKVGNKIDKVSYGNDYKDIFLNISTIYYWRVKLAI